MMRTTSGGRAAALLAAVVITCAACGAASTTTSGTTSGTDQPSPSTTHAGPDLPGGDSVPAIVVLRTGGIAGVHDMVTITANGAARFTSKTRTSRSCTPSAASVARLRAVDLSALPGPALTAKPPVMADGFHYSVQVGDQRAAVGEGRATGVPADLISAAAAVLASCQASQSGAPSGVS